MPDQDQLEIIDPSGRIRFYPLASAKGITNIGRHIDNDIIINRPGVAPFHAMLDHRSKPYHLVVLAQREKTTLDNEPAPVNIPTPLKSWSSIEIGGHQIIFLTADEPEVPSAEAAGLAGAGLLLPVEAAAADATLAPPTAPAAGLTPPLAPAPPPDPTTALTVEYSARALALDGGQTGTLDLTLINGGYKTLTFQVGVGDLDPMWVVVTPAQLEIPARQRATVTIAITPPHQPDARAGTQNASINVSSPDYPDWKNQARVAVTLNPYSEFTVSAISPRVQTIYYSQPSAQSTFEVTNRGNTEVAYRLSGEDERYACRYEFRLPGELLFQPRQAEIRLPPGQTAKIAVRISPINRYGAGLGPRRHFYTLNVAPAGGLLMPRSVLGELREEPLVGSLAFGLIALALLALFVLAMRPGIGTFTASPTEVSAGQEVTLTWSASPLASLRISPDVGAVVGPDGRMTITPTRDTVYTLIAENFLSWINPNWFRATRDVRVLVDPVLPSILFTTDRDTIAAGGSVILSWKVDNADELVLTTNGIPEAVPAGEFHSSKSIVLGRDTVFVLAARNKFTTADGVSATIAVRVTPGTAPAPPTAAPAQPVIDRFEVSPGEITAGQQVTIYWSVSGVDKVVIDPLPGEFPASGNLVVSPQQTTAYVLTATNGSTPVKLVKLVIVDPAPGAPRIDALTATPGEVVPGSPEAQNVKIAWQVSGETTDIQLAGPGLGPAVNLSAQGALTVSVDSTSTFTLTAFNGALTSVQSVQVKVNSPVPALAGLAPISGTAGAATLLVTVTGSNFVNGSVVEWNGSPRATTYVSATQLQAALTASDLATAGAAVITVFNPAPGGGLSGPQGFTVNNPAPVIASLSPNTVVAGSASLLLTITGSGFNTQSQVRWNGSQRAVSSAGPTQLTVLISSGDLAVAGAVTISVVNPVPGGGSDAAIFTIVAPTATSTPTPTPTPTVTPTPTPTDTPGP